MADANFGILERDVLLAKNIYEVHQKYGSPPHFFCNWNKTRPDRVYRVARELKEIVEIGAPMQTINEESLTALERKNLSPSDVLKMKNELLLDGSNTPLGAELILGLPMETVQSHIESNRKLIDIGAEPVNHNLFL